MSGVAIFVAGCGEVKRIAETNGLSAQMGFLLKRAFCSQKPR